MKFELIRPAVVDILSKVSAGRIRPKKLTLAMLRDRLAGFDAIAVPERTSLLLKRMGLTRPLYIHLDHGAGDAAVGYEQRIAEFDFLLMAGDKQRERMTAEGLLSPGRFAIVGYPKFEAADAIRDATWTPFSNNRPVVLYAPHHSQLGSWDVIGLEVLRSFAAQDEFNLIFAPHIRLFDDRKTMIRWQEEAATFSHAKHIYVDLGSERSTDMTYPELADVFIGEISSQVYEFLRKPRPCVFLNARQVAWDENPSYAHWRFGPVVETATEVLDAVRRSRADHSRYIGIQHAEFARTFDTTTVQPSVRAATAIASFLRKEIPNRTGNALVSGASTSAHSRETRRFWSYGLQAASALLLISAGWTARSWIPPQQETIAHEAEEAHDILSANATLFAGRPDYRRLAREIDVLLPRLPEGWQVSSAKIIRFDIGPCIQMAVLTKSGVPLTLFAANAAESSSDSLIFTQGDDEEVASWARGSSSYAVVAAASTPEFKGIARQLYEMRPAS